MIVTAIVAGAVVVLCLACLGFGFAGSLLSPDATDGGTSINSTPTEDEPTIESTYATPSPEDFTLTVKILRKKCFGSAGCNVSYRIEVGYDGPELDPDVTYEVTYEVRGVEDGPAVNTLELTGDEYSTDSEELASTSSESVKLKAAVTEISEI